MTKLERLKRANRVCLHLDGKPQFRYDPCGGALELVHMSNAETGTIETVARDVVIDHGTGLLRTVGIDPWGSNQSRALALLAGAPVPAALLPDGANPGATHTSTERHPEAEAGASGAGAAPSHATAPSGPPVGSVQASAPASARPGAYRGVGPG